MLTLWSARCTGCIRPTGLQNLRTKGAAMAHTPHYRPNSADAVRSRDEALARIRRVTVAIGMTATVAAVAMTGAIAVQSQSHAVATSATGATAATTTSGQSAVAKAPVAAPQATVAPAVATPAPAATTTSGQS